jgi:hypothetical protein
VSLTLEDAVKRALENNLDIAVQRINQQTYDVDIANVRSVYSPTFSSVVSSQSSKNASTSTISGAQTGQSITNSTFVFNGGIAQDVPWGGGMPRSSTTGAETTSATATINSINPTWAALYRNRCPQPHRLDTAATARGADQPGHLRPPAADHHQHHCERALAYWDYVRRAVGRGIAGTLALAEERTQQPDEGRSARWRPSTSAGAIAGTQQRQAHAPRLAANRRIA